MGAGQGTCHPDSIGRFYASICAVGDAPGLQTLIRLAKLRFGVPIVARSRLAPRTSPSVARPGLLLQRHPDQIDGVIADVPRLVAFADVDCGHPTDFTIGRRVGVRVLGLLLRSRGPLTPLDVNIEHIRMMSVHALPLTGVTGEPLNDAKFFLKEV